MTAKQLAFKNFMKSLGNFIYFDTDSLTIQDPMFNYYKDYHHKTVLLFPVDPSTYDLSVQEFLEVCDDASTHGMEIHYIGGKLYYSYII